MRHRVTFIHSLLPEDEVAESINATYVGLKDGFEVSREDRFTFPSPDYENVKSIKILVNKGYNGSSTTLPFAYTSQLGLHFYVKPVVIRDVDEREEFYNNSAKLVEDYFGVKPTSQQWVPSLNLLYFHVQQPLNLSFGKVDSSLSALSNDWTALDYLALDGTSSLKLFYPEAHERFVDVSNTEDFTEVGIFAIEDHSLRDDLILSGARVVLNDDAELDLVQRTLFHVKPRHRSTDPMEISLKKNGLHPTLSFGSAPQHPVDEDINRCVLYSYYTLEKSVFLDPYQIPSGFNILANYGPKDLELPEYAIPQWGNEILVEHNSTETFPFELTLHSRYQNPGSDSHKAALIDRPLVFYACEGQLDAYLLSNSPFDNKKSPGGSFEKFFTDDTIFYHALNPSQFKFSIPTATSTLENVNLMTIISLFIGVLFISHRLLNKARQQNLPEAKKDQ